MAASRGVYEEKLTMYLALLPEAVCFCTMSMIGVGSSLVFFFLFFLRFLMSISCVSMISEDVCPNPWR